MYLHFASSRRPSHGAFQDSRHPETCSCLCVRIQEQKTYISSFPQLDPPPKDPLYLIATETTFDYLREYSDLHDLGLGSDTPGAYAVKAISSGDIAWSSIGTPQIQRQIK